MRIEGIEPELYLPRVRQTVAIVVEVCVVSDSVSIGIDRLRVVRRKRIHRVGAAVAVRI